MIRRALARPHQPLDEEQRASLPIQVASRWALVVTAFLVVSIKPSFGTASMFNVGLVLLIAAGNAFLQWRLRSPRPLPNWQPAAVAALDVMALSLAIAVTDGFDNSSFAFYYPAFVAFALVFPGITSVTYTLLTLAVYVVIATRPSNFDASVVLDVKQLAVRLVTLVTVVAIANLAVRVERTRRRRAVEEALAAHLEHQRVTQEIHDGIAQEIYMLAVNLEANTKRIDNDPPLRERMEVLTDLARRALLETRSLLFNLEPVLTGDQGLVTLLTGQAAEFSAVTRVPIHVTATGSPPHLEPQATVEVYRIVQEALANIYRHADATNGKLSVARDGTGVVIRVEDNGSGFDAAEPAARGLGLLNMRDRAARIGGELRVTSTPGAGTTVELRVPLGKD